MEWDLGKSNWTAAHSGSWTSGIHKSVYKKSISLYHVLKGGKSSKHMSYSIVVDIFNGQIRLHYNMVHAKAILLHTYMASENVNIPTK